MKVGHENLRRFIYTPKWSWNPKLYFWSNAKKGILQRIAGNKKNKKKYKKHSKFTTQSQKICNQVQQMFDSQRKEVQQM